MNARSRKSHMSNKKEREKNTPDSEKPLEEKLTPTSNIPYKRIFIRLILIVVVMVIVYFTMEKEENSQSLAKATEDVTTKRAMTVQCSSDYESEKHLYPECVPKKCGRVVTDGIVTEAEAKVLLKTAKSGFVFGSSNGGASILDLHSGALSKGDKFVNIYKILEEEKNAVFTEKDFQIYRNVRNKIQRTIADHFEIPKHKLYLTSPTFFSQMTTKEAKTLHDEYWHVHTDKETYGSFHYTSLLYLSDHGKDFKGGRFIFVDEPRNTTIEPKIGRLSFFTSGKENPHFVEKLTDGVRYAITVSFTCDPSKAIEDPKLHY